MIIILVTYQRTTTENYSEAYMVTILFLALAAEAFLGRFLWKVFFKGTTPFAVFLFWMTSIAAAASGAVSSAWILSGQVPYDLNLGAILVIAELNALVGVIIFVRTTMLMRRTESS